MVSNKIIYMEPRYFFIKVNNRVLSVADSEETEKTVLMSSTEMTAKRNVKIVASSALPR